MKVDVYKLDLPMGSVTSTPDGGLKIEGDESFQSFMDDLNNDDLTPEEFVQQLPQRLDGIIWAAVSRG